MRYTDGQVMISAPVVNDLSGVPAGIAGIEGLMRVTSFDRYHFKIPACQEMIAGVYFLCEGAEVVYVGQSRSIAGRIRAHNWIRSKAHNQFNSVFYLRVDSAPRIRKQVEAGYIWILRPRLNRVKPKMVISDVEAEFAVAEKLDEYQANYTKNDWKMRKDLPYFLRQIVRHPEIVVAYSHIFEEAGFRIRHPDFSTRPAKFCGVGQGHHQIYI